MNRNFILLSAVVLLGSQISCSTKSASAKTPPVGFYKGKYYLSESEKQIPPEQLYTLIDNEARIAAELRSKEIKKAAASTLMQVGMGVALGGGHVNTRTTVDTPAARSRLKIQAYSDHLVSLGHEGR